MWARLPGQQGAQGLPVPVVGVQIHKYHWPWTALQSKTHNKDSIPVTAELFTLYKHNNSTQPHVLQLHSNKNAQRCSTTSRSFIRKTTFDRKTAKRPTLKLPPSHLSPPHIKTRSYAVKLGWYFWAAHVFVQCGSAWTTVESHPITSKVPKCCYHNAVGDVRPEHLNPLWRVARGVHAFTWSNLFWFEKSWSSPLHPSISSSYIKPTESLLQLLSSF